MSETLPHLPVGFRESMEENERALSYAWNRTHGAAWSFATVAAGVMSVVENGRESAPVALVIGAVSLVFIGLPLLVNRTRWTFQRRHFVIDVRPMRLRFDRVYPLDGITSFDVHRADDSDRIDLVMRLGTGENVTLHSGMKDEADAQRIVGWLHTSLASSTVTPVAAEQAAHTSTS